MSNNPTKQRKPSVGRGGVPTPDGFEKYPERRHNGAWKKTETARWKFEQWIKMTEDELAELLKKEKLASFDESTITLILQIQRLIRMLKLMVDEIDNNPEIEKKVVLTEKAMTMLEKVLGMLERLTNQIYGMPKQQVEQTNLEPPKPLSPRKQKKGEK